MKSETRLEEQVSESAQDSVVAPSPETVEAVAMADATARKLRKKRVDVKHLHREDKHLILSVPPYEIRLFKERPEPMYALYGPGPKTGKLPKRSDQYLSQGSLRLTAKDMWDHLLAEGLKECDGTLSGLEEQMKLCAFYFEDFLMDAIDKLGKAGEETI